MNFSKEFAKLLVREFSGGKWWAVPHCRTLFWKMWSTKLRTAFRQTWHWWFRPAQPSSSTAATTEEKLVKMASPTDPEWRGTAPQKAEPVTRPETNPTMQTAPEGKNHHTRYIKQFLWQFRYSNWSFLVFFFRCFVRSFSYLSKQKKKKKKYQHNLAVYWNQPSCWNYTILLVS